MFLRKSARVVAAAAALTLAAAVPAVADTDGETPEPKVGVQDVDLDNDDAGDGDDNGDSGEGGTEEDGTEDEDGNDEGTGDDGDATGPGADEDGEGPQAEPTNGPADVQTLDLEVGPQDEHEAFSFTIANITDFHGRIDGPGARLACYADENDVYLTSSGDSVGATPFISSAQGDFPTIDVLNAVGLEISALGNHELDRGWGVFADQINGDRPEDVAGSGGMNWEHLAANMSGGASEGLVFPSTVETFGDVTVGFVGAVTEELPTLITPSFLDDVDLGAIVPAVNSEAAALKADGVDLVVVLSHEAVGFVGSGFDADVVDVVFGGHSHVVVDSDGSTPILMQAGEYGTHVAEVVVTVDDEGAIALDPNLVSLNDYSVSNCVPREGEDGEILPATPIFDEVTVMVDEARAQADVIGDQELGYIAGDFNRAQGAVGEENRGEESTVGNLVADAQLWAVQQAEQFADTELSFMNPGGLRTDLNYEAELDDDDVPLREDGVLTLGEAAAMQPFANSLFVLTLTGQDVVDVLNEQVQPESASRPYLQLGISGLVYEYDVDTLEVTEVFLESGEPFDLDANYRVVANSFLVPGGDNFSSFTNASEVNDTGIIDLDAFVDFMAAAASDPEEPLDPNAGRYGFQRSWGFADRNGATTVGEVETGTEFELDYSGLWFTTGETSNPENVTVEFDGEVIGTFTITGDDADLEAKMTSYGRAEVRVTMPDLEGYDEGEEIPFVVSAGDNVLNSWVVEIGAGVDDGDETDPPTETEDPTDPPTETEDPTDPSEDPTDDPTETPGGEHPETGANVGGPLIAGLLLMGAGAVFLGVRRKMLA